MVCFFDHYYLSRTAFSRTARAAGDSAARRLSVSFFLNRKTYVFSQNPKKKSGPPVFAGKIKYGKNGKKEID
jgi:hypothetical protein